MRIVRSRKRHYLKIILKTILFLLCVLVSVLTGAFWMDRKNDNVAKDKRMYICLLNKDVEVGTLLKQSDIKRISVVNEGLNFSSVSMEECVGKRTRYALKKDTVLNTCLLCIENNEDGNIRKLPYTYIRNTEELKKGDIIDVRISFPNGADFVLLGKKEVIDLVQGETSSEEKLWLGLTEEEILRMSSGVVDAYLFEGAYIYAVLYANPLQNPTIVNYPINEVVQDLIKKDPNIIKIAQDKETFAMRNHIYENAPSEKEEYIDIQKEGLVYFD